MEIKGQKQFNAVLSNFRFGVLILAFGVLQNIPAALKIDVQFRC